ncbi:MAG: T9SS type A sorting domain-containing protein [Candidatus Brennerbacteria bacterium]|nr:T9SS type A sorting domain-containing protein [Candidatus Brennerbacteria bacterium]
MKRIWMYLAMALVIATASIPNAGWAQAVSADITISRNLLPDSLRNYIYSLWVDGNGDIFTTMPWKALLRSTDDGVTWKQIFKRDFLSNFGFAVMRDQKTNALLFGNGGGLYRSSDDGASWTFVWEKGAGCFLVKPDGSILAGTGKHIGHSEDGGVSWKTVLYRDDHYFNVEALAMSPKTGSLFAGTADTIGLGVLRSTDDGTTWHQSNSGLGDLHVWALATDNNGTIYAGVERKGLYRSTDDGVTWEKVPGFNASPRNAIAILVLKPDLICVGFGWKGGGDPVGKGGGFKYDGKAWTQFIADSIDVTSFAVKGKSLLVGSLDAIYRVDGAIDTPVSVEEEPDVIPSSFVLHQNFPNPFNPSTTITFSLPDRSHVRLAVWNVIGEEVATLVEEERSAGIHRIVWNAKGLPSGIYLYRMQTETSVQAKRMMLLK